MVLSPRVFQRAAVLGTRTTRLRHCHFFLFLSFSSQDDLISLPQALSGTSSSFFFHSHSVLLDQDPSLATRRLRKMRN